MKALSCSIIWICYHILLHERPRACDACSEEGEGARHRESEGGKMGKCTEQNELRILKARLVNIKVNL